MGPLDQIHGLVLVLDTGHWQRDDRGDPAGYESPRWVVPGRSGQIRRVRYRTSRCARPRRQVRFVKKPSHTLFSG